MIQMENLQEFLDANVTVENLASILEKDLREFTEQPFKIQLDKRHDLDLGFVLRTRLYVHPQMRNLRFEADLRYPKGSAKTQRDYTINLNNPSRLVRAVQEPEIKPHEIPELAIALAKKLVTG
jgi:hypothetical protein